LLTLKELNIRHTPVCK